MQDHLSQRWCSTATKPARLRRGLHDLPPPNWTVWRPENDHAHVMLHARQAGASIPCGPHRSRCDILAHGSRDFYAQRGGGGPRLQRACSLTTPMPSIYRSPYKTTWGREEPYTLDQLASVIPFNWEPPTVRQTGVGRNVDLFEAGMKMGWPASQCST